MALKGLCTCLGIFLAHSSQAKANLYALCCTALHGKFRASRKKLHVDCELLTPMLQTQTAERRWSHLQPMFCILGGWLCSMSDVSRQHWIVCAQAVLVLPGNTGCATQTMTSTREIPDTKNISAEHRDAHGGVGCGDRITRLLQKTNPLLPQTQEIVDVFPKIISSALLLSQPSGRQTDCRRTAALGECTTHPCCLK